jgi:hypothetical protein
MTAELEQALQSWHEFFVVGGHTGAVLLGLVFVGLELHIDRLPRGHHSFLIAAGSALGFLYVLLFSLTMLAPPLWPWVPGWALVGLSLLTFIGSTAPLFSALRQPTGPRRPVLVIVYLLPYVASFLAIAGSIGLVFGSVGALYVIALAVFIMIATGAVNAWYFLIRGPERINDD